MLVVIFLYCRLSILCTERPSWLSMPESTVDGAFSSF